MSSNFLLLQQFLKKRIVQGAENCIYEKINLEI